MGKEKQRAKRIPLDGMDRKIGQSMSLRLRDWTMMAALAKTKGISSSAYFESILHDHFEMIGVTP